MRTPGGSQGREQSFADVLNSLGNDPHRPSDNFTHESQGGGASAEEPVIPWLAPASSESSSAWGAEWGSTGGTEWPIAQERPATADEWGDPEDFAAAVRPYTWTRGRTRPVCDLAVETLVSTSTQGRDVATLASVEHRAVAEMCRGPRSVAEVAALLSLPLGVARVLLGDMADIGLVVVHRTATSAGAVPEFGFMERVLSGLRRL